MTLETPLAGSHRPTFYSSKGVAAIAAGEIPLARAYHRAAAAALTGEMNATHPAKDRHPLRFQVATQFFKAGDYEKAKRLAAQVDPDHLPPSLRPVFRQFLLDCEYRANPKYITGVRAALQACYPAGNWQRALDLLAMHPYVVVPAKVAFARAVSLEQLGKFRSAGRWYARAYSFGVTTAIADVAGIVDRLALEDRLPEAVATARQVIADLPHSFTYAAAAVAFYRAGRVAVDRQVMSELLAAQIAATEELLRREAEYDAIVREDPQFRGYPALALTTAAETFFSCKDEVNGERMLGAARRYDPVLTERFEQELRRQMAGGANDLNAVAIVNADNTRRRPQEFVDLAWSRAVA